MPSRKWWSKRKWPPTNGSDAASTSSGAPSSNKRGRFSENAPSTSPSRTRQANSSQRRSQPPSSESSTSSRASRPVQSSSSARPSRPIIQQPVSPADPTPPRDSFNELNQELEEDDSLNEIVLALDVKGRGIGNSRLGGCYYIAREEKLYFIVDLQSGGMEAVETMRLHAQPTVILLPSRVDETVDKILDPRKDNDSESMDYNGSSSLPYVLDIRPSKEFDYEGGKRALSELQLPADSNCSIALIVPGHEDPYQSYVHGLESGFTGRQGKLLALSTFVDLESDLSVGCAGALLAYLQRRRSVMFLPGDRDAERCLRVSNIEMVPLSGYMLVSTDTLAALQIVQAQTHPNAQNQGPRNTGSKEALSVYGIFQHLAKTPQGRTLLRQHFLRPSLNLDEINERHATISTFLLPDNESKMDEICKSLNQVKNMRLAMLHLHKGLGNGKGGGIKNGVWMNLRSFAFYALAVRTACLQVVTPSHLLILTKVIEQFHVHQLATIGRLVTDIVDFQQSQQYHRTVVTTGVDEELDGLKRTYDGLEDLLGETSRSVASTIPQQFSIELTVVFIPQIGFLICMPMDPSTHRALWEGGPGDEQWERIFSTERHVYYKDYRMHELDERIGDVYAAICDKEIEIVHELAQKVLAYETMLCTVSDLCGELDALLGLAQGARLYKLTRPRMTTQNVVDIYEGRHLLQELAVANCIPNDTLLVGGAGPDTSPSQPDPDHTTMPPPPLPSAPPDAPSMLILTGPNYSGKSIYLKHVALIVYLAHVGAFVPASRARIGLTDRILTRVATRESVTRPQSAFAIDLQQVATALRTATRRSLVLLDEFGKGTAASDGAGLLCGALVHLLNRPEEERAKVLVATHFHELFEPFEGQDNAVSDDDSSDVTAPRRSFLPPRPGLAFAHMAVHVDTEAERAAEQVTYLYQLQPGRSISSLGVVCAALNGIDAAVVARAEDLLILEARGGDLVAACCGSGDAADDGAELEAAERVARQFLAAELADGDDEDDEDIEVDGTGDPWRALLESLV